MELCRPGLQALSCSRQTKIVYFRHLVKDLFYDSDSFRFACRINAIFQSYITIFWKLFLLQRLSSLLCNFNFTSSKIIKFNFWFYRQLFSTFRIVHLLTSSFNPKNSVKSLLRDSTPSDVFGIRRIGFLRIVFVRQTYDLSVDTTTSVEIM